MLAFTNPIDALCCATSVQRAIATHDFAGEEIRVRIGLHTGDVIAEADDFCGRTVILAARVAESARGGEVLVTPQVRAAVPDGVFDHGREVSLKGSAALTRCSPPCGESGDPCRRKEPSWPWSNCVRIRR